jgi:hypothetical protein
MANTKGEASATSVPEMVQDDEVSNWARLALARLSDEPTEAVTEKKLVTAIEKAHEPNKAPDARGSQLGRALDQLLLVAFASISPAYLFFGSFPPEG